MKALPVLSIPILFVVMLTQVNGLHMIALSSWQASSMTIGSIAYGGGNYFAGVEYLYSGYMIIPRPDCTHVVTIVNLMTGKLVNLATSAAAYSCWIPYYYLDPVHYLDRVKFVDPWLTINDVVYIAATYTT
ncbi:MAG: hypothetical protein ACLPY5_14280 [Candidatus Bathyarchaeia archaeon]